MDRPARHRPRLECPLPMWSGTGHGDLVRAADGSWWMVLLGTRPRVWFPEFHVLGRDTFLMPVEWVGAWPRLGPVRERHPGPAAWRPSNGLRCATTSPPRRRCRSGSPRTACPRGPGPSPGGPGGSPGTASTAPVHLRRPPPAAPRLPGRAGLPVRLDEGHHCDLEVAAAARRPCSPGSARCASGRCRPDLPAGAGSGMHSSGGDP
ncbi:family 43 glycosylhydrolase [Streptomyces lasalocidi]